jgi:predicted N-formylglutamate amidohydrolase
LQETPGGKSEQAGYDNPNEKIAERLSQQGLEAPVAVLGFGRIMGCQQREDTDDQVKHTSSGVASPGEYDKAALRGHWMDSRE